MKDTKKQGNTNSNDAESKSNQGHRDDEDLVSVLQEKVSAGFSKLDDSATSATTTTCEDTSVARDEEACIVDEAELDPLTKRVLRLVLGDEDDEKAPQFANHLTSSTLEADINSALVGHVETPLDPALVPGAHAVAGIGSSERNEEQDHELSSSDLNETVAEDPPVIGGAVVVGEDTLAANEEATERGEASIRSMPMRLPDEDVVIMVSREESTTPSSGKKRLVLSCAAILLLVLVVVLLVEFLVPVLSSSEFPEDTKEEVLVDTTEEVHDNDHPAFRDGLGSEVISGLEDPTSPYYHANLWMLGDPNLHSYSSARQLQRFAMVSIYFQTGGENWTRNDHWLSYEVSECLWYNQNSSLAIGGWNPGMTPEPTCDEESNLVVFNLTSNNLVTESFMGNHGLSYFIKIVDVSNNEISGAVPSIFDHAANLEVVDLSNNSFAGGIRGSLGFDAFNIRIVRLDSNRLIGFTSIIFNFLPDLEVLNITNNLYSKEIGSSIQACKNLTYVGMGGNDKKGTIPTEYGLLTNLVELDFSNNPNLVGKIPSELGNIPGLSSLDVSRTEITGAVPSSLCNAAAMGTLEIGADCGKVECCS